MDKAIFQFDSNYYDDDIFQFSRETCEHLANVDVENVNKFDLESEPLEELLKNDMFGTANCLFRLFI